MSTVRRRRLALELRRLREATDLTCEDVAGQLDCSASKISRIETGKVLASPRDVRDIAEIYGVSDEQRDSLVQLAREARQKGWWQAYGDSVEPHLATYLGMESTASEIRVYRAMRLPGLLQTEDYARALFAVSSPGSARPDERSIAYRIERQQQAKVSRPRLWAVLDEAALRRQVGGPEVMRAQFEHLVSLTAESEVFLQIIPFTAGPQFSMDLPFAILAFPDQADPDVVCIRYATGTVWIEETAEVRTYSVLFRHLQAAALSRHDSLGFVTSMLSEL